MFDVKEMFVFSGIAKAESKIVKIDFDKIQTNIIAIQVNSPNFTAMDFVDRLKQVKIFHFFPKFCH